ncbi:GTP-binding protein [Thermithiobacillus tepidarius DSM 3134]|uniref:GTP-binding protein n=1 Tax=Thermithiobacillus tepidarius TaxID=929 RepID=UPI000424D2CB|nr:hypothetical protein [Thermithiobacillus tepidarius]
MHFSAGEAVLAAPQSPRKRPKLLLVGSPGAGKTTAIKAFSSIPPVSTEARSSELDIRYFKESTTVALDYGYFVLNSGAKVDLYAAPGQERFSFMWEILSQHCTGLVLLVDATRPDPQADLRFFLDRFHALVGPVPTIVGINKSDGHGFDQVQGIRDCVRAHGQPLRAETVDVRNPIHVKRLILTLLRAVDPRLLQVAAGA